MSRVLLVVAVLVSLSLAGCVADPAGEEVAAASTPADEIAGAHAVLAVIDTGINPYHVVFRDDSALAQVHPSRYLPGFPADTPALNLTFNASDYLEAVAADCAVWNSVQSDTLYWIPGTRIVGAITSAVKPNSAASCAEDDLPDMILDQGSHGTMTASRAAGNGTSACPDCRIVAVQGFSSDNVVWAAKQAYIDVQTNSWGSLPPISDANEGADRANLATAVATGMPIFFSGGNGIGGFFGGVGHPEYPDPMAGAAGLIMVGGHDAGRYTPWTATMPHVVTDAMWSPAARYHSLDEVGPRVGGGTSGAAPFAAGTLARLLLDARSLIGDTTVGVGEGGALATVAASSNGSADATLAGPAWEDGVLSAEELRAIFFATADPRPKRDGDYDGDACDVSEIASGSITCALYVSAPVEWGMIPDDVPAYYFVGYGQVGVRTLDAARAVLLEGAPQPERAQEDEFFAADAQVREAYADVIRH